MSHKRSDPEPLSTAECQQLLASTGVGRVIFTENALPSATPVNYVMDGHAVVFRTSPGSRLARATDDAVVAFEVDHIDDEHRSGWSVLVVGVAEVLRGAGEILRAEQLGLVSWVDGERGQYVRIAPGAVTGRRIGTPVATA